MAGPERVLSLVDVVAIVIGVVIGAGIFSLPSLIAGILGDPWLVVTAWVAGGLLALIGVLCFAELATAFPHPGGEYHFLARAYGRECAFMYAWARMTVIQTGSIATLSFVAGDYAQQLLPLGSFGPAIYAALSVIVFTYLNILGIRQTTTVQKVLETITVLGLVALILAGFSGGAPAPAPAASSGANWGGLGLAMVFVLFTFGGWNEAVYVSAEVRDGSRNMVRGLIIGIGVITLLYVIVNIAFIYALGVGGMAGSKALGTDVMRTALGDGAALFMTVLILVIVLTSVNVTILTGARTGYAVGRDFHPFRFLGHWTEGASQPVRALLAQGGISLVLVVLGALSREGVKTMVEYLSPVFWLFFLLTGFSLIVLRYREPDAERPFRVPLYPITPVIFCLSSAYVLYSSLAYTGVGALVGVAVLVAGLPFLIWIRKTSPRIQQST